MRITILNTYDGQGGAAIATYRIHKGLMDLGLDSILLVQKKITNDRSVFGAITKWQKILAICRPYSDLIPLWFYKARRKDLFSSAWLLDSLKSRILKMKPDIVHIFWINGGFLKIETLGSLKQPVVWTLHDMWPFTGGCHYDGNCGRYKQACGSCPILGSDSKGDLSHFVFERKRKSWANLPFVVVATSNWLADVARSSALFASKRIVVIPNGINTKIYKPCSKTEARAVYNLPQNKHLILFSAFSATSDERKGHQFLIPALSEILNSRIGRDVEVLIVGALKSENSIDLGVKVHYFGMLHDEISQVLLYSAADVLVAPSMQENLSNTVMESLACGTPVVAFNIGGMPDMIDHMGNGYLAVPFEHRDLAAGIVWILEDASRMEKLSRNARQTVLDRFEISLISNKYRMLYADILSANN